MQVTTKFNVGDMVWFIIDGYFVQCAIDEIYINVSKRYNNQIEPVQVSVRYKFELGMATEVRGEDDCWSTPEEFISKVKERFKDAV